MSGPHRPFNAVFLGTGNSARRIMAAFILRRVEQGCAVVARVNRQ